MGIGFPEIRTASKPVVITLTGKYIDVADYGFVSGSLIAAVVSENK